MEIVQWFHTFRFVIFDPKITDASKLHSILSEYAKARKDRHPEWLDNFSVKTDLFRDMVKVLPQLREQFETTITDVQLAEQKEIMKKIITKLTLALEEKL